jgi:SAM-dependent methyltransferase
MDKELPNGVSEQRWREAQVWERTFWDRQNVPPPLWKRLLRPLLVAVGLRRPLEKPAFDDRNLWWRNQFDNYSMLPATIGRICELGCGPYTNVRLIIQGRDVETIVCSDPLAEAYATYPSAWLATAYREGRVTIDSHPAEECPFPSDHFNVVVMINVLDHVRSPEQCLEQAFRITEPGGIFVFGQDLSGDTDEKPYNPGHPFTLDHEQLIPWLDERYERVFIRMIPRQEIDEPAMHYGGLCYVGRKRNTSLAN